ncbi:MAG: 1-(5-phosphoribosyl)-5-((5-phosphoribosylamino)methylideneamino)imidazole-4-carboxamide isomerase, partial [Synechococcus sp. SB0666_bin_14]|nr:1-(5-phosphoribosyl)-5-((5-phosphoribosylamino)methylideneamino)imidazole-4-carboxamide isomerase [Synechococcus sp. SB0666_bin_14]
MEVIPAIDLLDGACVRLRQGDYGQVTRFSDDPVAMARQWQQLGAQRLHLVDLDGARRGEPSNDATIKAIASTVEIPVQLGGGVRSVERAKDLLACGVDRVILGTAALENPQLVRRLAQAHPGRIAVGIDARNGLVATRGWLHQSPM